MDNDLAVKIKNFLQQAEGDKTTNYKILRIEDGFHPWADGRKLVAAFRVINQDDLTYYLLIIVLNGKLKSGQTAYCFLLYSAA